MEVDLALSAHANARRWYEMKKKQESKQEKTISAHVKAFKAAERKTQLQLSQVDEQKSNLLRELLFRQVIFDTFTSPLPHECVILHACLLFYYDSEFFDTTAN